LNKIDELFDNPIFSGYPTELEAIVIHPALYKRLKTLASGRGENVFDFFEEREEDILAEATKGMNRKQRRTFLSQYRKNKKNDHLRKA
jgi:hypothetical protein